MAYHRHDQFQQVLGETTQSSDDESWAWSVLDRTEVAAKLRAIVEQRVFIPQALADNRDMITKVLDEDYGGYIYEVVIKALQNELSEELATRLSQREVGSSVEEVPGSGGEESGE